MAMNKESKPIGQEKKRNAKKETAGNEVKLEEPHAACRRTNIRHFIRSILRTCAWAHVVVQVNAEYALARAISIYLHEYANNLPQTCKNLYHVYGRTAQYEAHYDRRHTVYGHVYHDEAALHHWLTDNMSCEWTVWWAIGQCDTVEMKLLIIIICVDVSDVLTCSHAAEVKLLSCRRCSR